MRERVSSSYYGTAKAETDQVVSIFELQYKGEQKILKFWNSTTAMPMRVAENARHMKTGLRLG